MPFTSIAGHRRLIDLLRAAVTRDRVPQSLLLAGPEGVGKRAVAVALAQAVNCPSQTGGDACGTCSTCRRIAAGQHADVAMIDRGDQASIKIGVLRERLLEVAGYRPFEARRRVYIIDGADDLTEQSQDALLKTLEEPPPSAILILITAYPDTLRPTVQSRCRRLRFGPLAEPDVARVLTERYRVDAVKARLLAVSSGGSISRALAEEATDAADDRDAAMDLLVASAGSGVMAKLKAATALAQHGSKRRDRDALGSRLAIVGSLCRDMIAQGAGAADAMAYGDLADALRGVARTFDADRLSRAFTAVSRAQHALDRNAGPKIVADWIALSI